MKEHVLAATMLQWDGNQGDKYVQEKVESSHHGVAKQLRNGKAERVANRHEANNDKHDIAALGNVKTHCGRRYGKLDAP